jgi:ArsR family transcriptional regulator
MPTLCDAFRGLADPTRLRIVNLLLEGELCGCDIQKVLDLAQPNVSRHLIYLKNSGLVLDRRAGYRVFYRLTGLPGGGNAKLFEFLRGQFRKDPLLRKDIKSLKEAVRSGACSIRPDHTPAEQGVRPGVAMRV